MNLPLKIGSRQSPLAQVQVREVISLLSEPVTYELCTFQTRGDKDKTTSLTDLPADDFFTDVLDQALIDGRIDIAIHSAKDLPKKLPEQLRIFALTQSLDDTDAWVGKFTLNELKPGTRIGTSSLLRQSQIRQLYPQATCVDIRGTINERLQLLEQGTVDGLVIASCALKRLGLTHLIKDIFPWEATALQGQLAVVGRREDLDAMRLFQSLDVRLRYGKVSLVGAGPGDPGLITLKGKSILSKADCVFYDYLVNPLLLNHAPCAEHIYAGKRKGDHVLSQDELNKRLRVKAMAGKNVVRLKGGDPLIFGRGADEINYLSSYHITVDVIPGVSSATGIPSLLGVPLTARGVAQSVAFVSAHEEDENIKGVQPVTFPKADTLVFLMGLTKLPFILKSLRLNGFSDDTPILIVSKGTCVDQRIVKGTLKTIESLVAKAKISPPALIIAGQVVEFYKQQHKATYLHCGLNPELYSHLGVIIPWPMIDISAIDYSAKQLKQLAEDFDACDMIVLTSPNAVKFFVPMIVKIKTLKEVQAKIITVIGKHTLGLLEEYGIKAQIIASYETAQGLFDTLHKVTNLKGRIILFPRSELPNPFLKEALIKEGAKVLEHAVYHNKKPSYRPLPDVPVDGIIFTSPSTVTHFIADYKVIPKDWRILVKGPVTAAAVTQAGYTFNTLT